MVNYMEIIPSFFCGQTMDTCITWNLMLSVTSSEHMEADEFKELNVVLSLCTRVC